MNTRSGPAAAVAALCALASAACSDGSDAPVGAPIPTEPDGGQSDFGLALERVVDGLDAPVLVTSAPGDSRLFVVERPGRIRIVAGGSVLARPFVDITALTTSGGERGLLGLAFHPGYATNGRLYVNHTDLEGDTRVVELTATDPDRADPSSLRTVLEVAQPFSNHNGGHLAFGPDGMLYIGLGDGGSGGDPQGNGQRPSTLLGSMLRVDVDGAGSYEVPQDNPFLGDPSAAPETWAFGLRNPWRFSFDRVTGDLYIADVDGAGSYEVPQDNPFLGDPSAAPETWAFGLRNPWRFSFDRVKGDLYIADVGQNAREEISFQPSASGGGQNYGWNVLEGSSCFATAPCDPTGTTLPVHEYTHADGCSVTGGYVYRGAAVPSMAGRYVFSDFCGGWIRSFRVTGGVATDLVDHTQDISTNSNVTIANPVSFGEDADGELYVVSLDGAVYRVTVGG